MDLITHAVFSYALLIPITTSILTEKMVKNVYYGMNVLVWLGII